MLDLWPLKYPCANISPNLFLLKCKQQHLDKLKEVKTPWVLFGASNGGHSMTTNLLPQLTKSSILWFLLDSWPLKNLCANMDSTLFFQKCKQQHWNILNEVKTPWIFVGASNSGHSMIAYLLRQLTKSNILWFVLDLWPLKILAPTWTQIYFSTNASSSTEINLMKWKHHFCLLAQRAVNTLKVHIVLHEPLSGLLCTMHWH